MNKYHEGTSDVQNNIRAVIGASSLKGWEVQQSYSERFGKMYSESTITARMREMADVSCDLSTYTYSIKG